TGRGLPSEQRDCFHFLLAGFFACRKLCRESRGFGGQGKRPGRTFPDILRTSDSEARSPCAGVFGDLFLELGGCGTSLLPKPRRWTAGAPPKSYRCGHRRQCPTLTAPQALVLPNESVSFQPQCAAELFAKVSWEDGRAISKMVGESVFLSSVCGLGASATIVARG